MTVNKENLPGQFTLEQWNKKGYQIKIGETHAGRNIFGEATFKKSQVILIEYHESDTKERNLIGLGPFD